MSEEKEVEEKEEEPPKRKRRRWDEETRNKFQDEMEEIIYEMIGEYRMEDEEIEKFVDEIVDIANKKLKQARVKNYVYWTTVFVCSHLNKHKHQRGMTWEDAYDHVE